MEALKRLASPESRRKKDGSTLEAHDCGSNIGTHFGSPGKWSQGLKPALFWWFSFDPYPHECIAQTSAITPRHQKLARSAGPASGALSDAASTTFSELPFACPSLVGCPKYRQQTALDIPRALLNADAKLIDDFREPVSPCSEESTPISQLELRQPVVSLARQKRQLVGALE